MADLSGYFVWNADPVLMRVAGKAIRAYTVCFFLLFVVGYAWWHWQMLRGLHASKPVSRMLPWGAFGIIAGGRLAHCLFYEPAYYLAHPVQILDLSRGGVASHGSVLGLALAIVLYARHYDYSLLELLDRMAPGAVLAASLVRVGTLFNSEIVGREWYGPWAVRFPRFTERLQQDWERAEGPLGWLAQPLPRHPAQLYEAAGMLVVFLLVLAVDRHYGERRWRGLLVGLVLTLLFSFRLAVESFKEYQRFAELAPDAAAQVIRVVPLAQWTMGQWLSPPFVAAGLTLVLFAWRRRLPAARPSRFD